MLLLIFICSFFCLSLLAQEPDLGTEEQRTKGKILYEKKCAQCHGVDGDGKGVGASRFKPLPRNFTTAQYKIRSTANGELPTDHDIKKIIREGMPYTGMPPWPDLTEEEITNLVYYLKAFSDDFADPDYLPKPINFPEPPPYNEESAAKGRAVFEKNACVKCHGEYGRGDGLSATSLQDDNGQHIMPADMTKRWTFRGGGSREDIYRTFTTGINGTPMPSYQGVISPEEQWQLVDYVYSLSEDEPDYGILVISKPFTTVLDIAGDSTLFDEAQTTLFPIVGQVLEPGREFFPGTNAIEVQSVYNADSIAIRVQWNNISADTSGKNGPDLEAPLFTDEQEEENDFWGDLFDTEVDEEQFSDALAVQLPSEMPQGNSKPYFLFGDSKKAVDLWFCDLADTSAKLYQGRGIQNIIMQENSGLQVFSNYRHGRWTVTFKKERISEKGLSFEEGSFIPISFTVWDGFNKERGNKRGISSWYHLYMEPLEKESVVGPMIKWSFIIALLELGLIFGIRRKYKNT
jgi:cbb3-type cytochrome c oxidase subunit III